MTVNATVIGSNPGEIKYLIFSFSHSGNWAKRYVETGQSDTPQHTASSIPKSGERKFLNENSVIILGSDVPFPYLTMFNVEYNAKLKKGRYI